jgi:hypothetical protein
MTRFPLAALVALPLAGCVIPTDQMRLASARPGTESTLVRAARPLRAGDTVGLAVLETTLDRARLKRCIAGGMTARLPDGVALVSLDETRVVPLAAAPSSGQGDLPEAVASVDADWAVLVRDVTQRSSSSGSRLIEDRGGSFGVLGGTETTYQLRLDAVLLDLRARRGLGQASASYVARGSEQVAAGIASFASGTGFAVPFVLPILRLPAGTSAMAICDAFGRAVGEALVAAAAPPSPSAEP